MKSTFKIRDNRADGFGGGVLLAANLSVSMNNSSPSMFNNTAAEYGVGIFISKVTTLNLMGRTNITGNIATAEKSIYKRGKLNLSESPKVLDRLLFGYLQPILFNPSVPRKAFHLQTQQFQVPLDKLADT